MTTESAIRAMLDGKKVNRKDFVEEVYAYEKGVFFNQYGMTIQGFGDNDDWEIYEEPKPKQTVVLYEWMVCPCKGSCYIKDGLRTEEDANREYKLQGYKSWKKTGRSFEVEL